MKIKARGIYYFIHKHQAKEDLPTIVLLHGFMGSGDSFHHLIPLLKRVANPITIDLMGHGQSDGYELHYQFSAKEQIASLKTLLEELCPEGCTLYGYSMGARLALLITLQHPECVNKLVLESGTFGIEQEQERISRQSLDEERADLILSNFESFLDDWKEMPLFKHSDDKLTEDIQKGQNPLWMANSLLGFGTGSMPNLKPRLPEIEKPTLLLCGSDDSKFCQINQTMVKLIPKAEIQIIPQSGHRVHIDQPVALSEALIPFIEN